MTSLRALTVLALLGAVACGEEHGSLVRVTLAGVRGDEPLHLEEGRAEVGGDFSLYAAAVRIGRIEARTTDDRLRSDSAINADLFTSTILLEGEARGDATAVKLEFPEPEPGSGVAPGQNVSLFVAGLFKATPFEFRAPELRSLEMSLAARGNAVALHLDFEALFDAVDGESLVPEGGVLRIETPHDGDPGHNVAAASALQEAFGAALVVGYVGESATELESEDVADR